MVICITSTKKLYVQKIAIFYIKFLTNDADKSHETVTVFYCDVTSNFCIISNVLA